MIIKLAKKKEVTLKDIVDHLTDDIADSFQQAGSFDQLKRNWIKRITRAATLAKVDIVSTQY